jgi:hypothetical protein
MKTLTTEELDHQEVEFLPSRVVMSSCSPCNSCRCDGITIVVVINVGFGCR